MKTKLYLFAQFVGFALLFYILGLSSLQRSVFPFGFACLFALVWANQKLWVACPAFVIGSSLADLTIFGFVSSVVCVGVLSTVYIIFYYKKVAMPKWVLFVVAFVSQMGHTAMFLSGGGSVFLEIAHLAIGLGFMFMLTLLLEGLVVRGFSCKLTIVELLGAGLFVMAMAGGLTEINFLGFSLFKFVALLVILFVNNVSSFSTMFFNGAFLALGSCLP